MFAKSTALFALFAASLAQAQAPTTPPTNHVIQVGVDATGAPATAFTPSNITAAAGDMVTFEFVAGNHTVSQSTFADPCALAFNLATNTPGATSGFVPADATKATMPSWAIQVVNASTPLWFFCERTPHCMNGMVFSINANEASPKNFAAFKANALASQQGPAGTFNNVTIALDPAAIAALTAPAAPAAPGAPGAPATPDASANGTAPSGTAADPNAAANAGASAPSTNDTSAGTPPPAAASPSTAPGTQEAANASGAFSSIKMASSASVALVAGALALFVL